MALSDALGNLIDFRLLPGQTHDLRGTAALIKGLARPVPCRPRLRCKLGARCLDWRGDRGVFGGIDPPDQFLIPQTPAKIQPAIPARV
jgi:hypothetical protein